MYSSTDSNRDKDRDRDNKKENRGEERRGNRDESDFPSHYLSNSSKIKTHDQWAPLKLPKPMDGPNARTQHQGGDTFFS